MQRRQQEGQEIMDNMRRASDARRKAQADNFAQSLAVRQRVDEQFFATMQRGTDMSMRRAADVANSNHRMASDVVDYALDRQTVRDPTTGRRREAFWGIGPGSRLCMGMAVIERVVTGTPV